MGGADAALTIAVVGAGAWGSGLAHVCCRANHKVLLWGRDKDLVAGINARHENPSYLPGIALSEDIEATGDLADLATARLCLLVVPAQALRKVAGDLAGVLDADVPLVLCAKGIEAETNLLMTEVAAEALPGRPLAVLSGPTFAAEVARGLPTAVTLASEDRDLAARLVVTLGSRSFRPYLSDDPLGAEIAGAVKNVLAIACGIVAGRQLGDNARAALITRGLAEMSRLVLARGGKPETLMGLAGLGDLTLTCTATQSRNYSFGVALGQGADVASATAASRGVVEGRFTAAATLAMARTFNVEMPICAAVDAVVNHGAALDETIAALLARPFKAEGFSA
ncbi:NAD(P)H-dependent glycerol-3-phosphate dehydrogenase [Pelagibius marinus]|uniref:NAD(P)H-dependent glycerol-3-phosphate dehydrogenase n=1 Tax=Pelagibius marinus TaxID=2762760 RepID=UPI001872F80E|nr:NAD(P)H-dependent glycerol-3-phosphate dehydrogenase [Pelagibius marinus]